jgi:hypothetical protein
LLVEFRENPWYAHICATLRDLQFNAQQQILNHIPSSEFESRIREQLIGGQRDVELFYTTAETLYTTITNELNERQHSNGGDSREQQLERLGSDAPEP